MNLEFKHLLPESFSPQSRVWVYQCNRPLFLSEALDMEPLIEAFCNAWQSHGAQVAAYGNLFFGRFLVLMADESSAQVSGCSTDSSVRFVKELEQRFKVSFFDRTSLAFFIKDNIQVLPMNQLGYALDNQFLNGDTLFFNNVVQTKAELENGWIIPLKNSWLAKRLKLEA